MIRLLCQHQKWIPARTIPKSSRGSVNRGSVTDRAETERVRATRAAEERQKTEVLRGVEAQAERIGIARLEAEREKAERTEAERVHSERGDAERTETATVEAERVDTERAETERVRATRAAEEKTIPVEDILAGAVLAVRAGDMVVADGVVLKGTGVMDESSLRGEAAPVAKSRGDRVLSGNVMQAGYLEFGGSAAPAADKATNPPQAFSFAPPSG
jgi:hypothetical protein